MHEIATLVNEKKRESENIERVLDLEAKIDGFPVRTCLIVAWNQQSLIA